MSDHGEMVKLLSRTLTGNDAARRRAEHEKDLARRNELANANVGLVSAASPAILHSLVLSWMLDRTRKAELLEHAGAALRVALAHADGEVPDVNVTARADELAGCREVLRKLTEATT
jgi:hypothetical protein